MRSRTWLVSVVFTAMALMLTLITAKGAPTDEELLKTAQQIFGPLPTNMADPGLPFTAALIELGRKLFFDPRVSVDGTVSCARCHQSALYGTDGLPKPRGAHDRENPRNSPTVLNAALQFTAHWRGDRVNVEDQAQQALIGPASFGNPSYEAAMNRLKGIPGYAELFAKAFPNDRDPITPKNWGQAIGAFERTLVTPSRFDDYLRGDVGALSPQERNGLQLFINTGCIACHNGPGIGGNTFQKFGVYEDYWKATGVAHPDAGRFDVTKDANDRYVFKVPSLRNVAMTPPYFHDGSVRALPDAVRIMARVQLNQQLSDSDIQEIVAFLSSLTGNLPQTFVESPTLPASAFDNEDAEQ